MSGNSNSDGAFMHALRQFEHVLDTMPVVGQSPRSWEIPELRRLIDPDGARKFLPELDGSTDAPAGSFP